MSNINAKKWHQAELEEASKFSFKNEASIRASNLCGCFYCLAIFNADVITDDELLRETDGLRTVWCPKCGIDSVLGDQCGYPISAEFLAQMNLYRFNGH